LRLLTSVRGYLINNFVMELSQSPQNRPEESQSASEDESFGGVSLFLRLWTYGGPSRKVSGLGLEQDREIAELTSSIIRDGKGVIAERQPEWLSAHFHSALHALSTAMALQQHFLTFRRNAESQQRLPSILISRRKNERLSGAATGAAGATAPPDMLAKVNSAQILICDSIYQLVKSAPGFQFNPKPVREAGQTGDPEAIYELLWTDESTYGLLRKASGIGLSTVGRYQIQEELGRGAMGAVYKAYDPLIGRTVALKAIPIAHNAPDRDDLIERLKQEAKAAGKLDHPNIITIYDVGQEDDVVYLSMQFVEGKTLLTFLVEIGVPSLPTLISWADQISSAVGFAHAHGVIHRDLKPANLMLTNQGVIKVLDFGIAKVESSALTQTGLVMGTPSHMAPEQVAGKKIDNRADIFALGSVFYELVTREKPFRGDITTILYKIMHEDPVAPSLVNPALPGGIDAVIRKALAKDPKDRFQTCEDMRNAFLEQAALLNIQWTAPAPVGVAVAKLAPRPPATFSVHLLGDTAPQPLTRIWTSIAAVLVLAFLGAMTWAFSTWSQPDLLPSTVKKVVAMAYGTQPRLPSSTVKTEESSGQQSPPAASEEPTQKTGGSDAAGVGTNSNTEAPAVPNNAKGTQTEAAPKSPSGSSTVFPQPAGEQLSNNQPPSDGTHASSADSSTRPAQVSQGNSSDPDQPVIAPSLVPVQQSHQNQREAESASEPNAPAANADSSKVPVIQGAEDSQTAATPSATKPLKKSRRESALTVDGFSRHDIPELLRQADAAAQRGDYRLARYGYNLILRLDPGNISARAGLYRVQAAQHSH
jgi:eukaryotic-like serine/threonine-protein kinase